MTIPQTGQRGPGVLPTLVMVNGLAWLLLIPAVIAVTGGGVEVVTVQQKVAFFVGVVAVLGGTSLVNALFSLALARALALREGTRPMLATLIGGFLQFAAAVSGALAFGRTDALGGDPSAGSIVGLTLVWLVYGAGHLLQALATRRLAPQASVIHAIAGFACLLFVPLLGFQLDLEDFGVPGIILGVTQAVLGLAFPFVIGVVWLRYAVALRKPLNP